MNVLFINETCGTGSHGRICVESARQLEKTGNRCKIAYGRVEVPSQDSVDLAIRIGSMCSVYAHVLQTRIFDLHGFGSYVATKKFLKWVDTYKPEMLWLHNLHGYYLHVGLLFHWIKKHPEVQVKWTLHDCWSFTGHCSHYMAVTCDHWKTQCHHCPERKQYPASLVIDNSCINYRKKRELFTGIPNMELITPSQWLADQVKQSYLKDYPVSVIHNEIDHSVFYPLTKKKEEWIKRVREKYGVPEERQILLGVASKWSVRKGMDDFLKLDKELDHLKQVLVLVGISKEEARTLPSTVIGIVRTENREELAAIYNMADVFVNLSYEENYPTVNLEAEACGTDVFTYDAGGCRETVHREGSKVYPVGSWRAILLDVKKRIK